MSLESFERRGLILKLETVEGTDSTPTPAADALQILDGQSSLASDTLERALDRPFFGANPATHTKFRGTISGNVELAGAATPGTACPLSSLLQISGFAETLDPTGPPPNTTYNPISTAIKSASAYFYHAGTLKKLLGARASMSGIATSIGGYPMAQINIEGACDDVSEIALPTTFDYSAFQAPVPVTHDRWMMSVAGNNVEAVEFSIDLGNTLATKEHSEGLVSRITDRQPTGVLRCYRPLIATFDAYDAWKVGTLLALVSEVDSGTAGGKTRITVGTAQVDSVEETDIEGDLGYAINFRCIPTSAGDDELLIEFE